MLSRILLPILLLVIASSGAVAEHFIEDVFVPEQCHTVTTVGDHLLIEFEFILSNGTATGSVKAPHQLFHLQLSDESLPVQQGLTGICLNGTRNIIWENPTGADFSPIVRASPLLSSMTDKLTLEVKVHHITPTKDYQIFDAFTAENTSLVLDLIDEHIGINAVDEWGQTPLIIAIANQNLMVFAALMNTRRPMVDVNTQKSSGYTALIYAVERAPISILQALLRRGADPNAAVLQEGSRGNTALHFACLLEKVKHTEILIAYGANIYATNEHGQTPLQLLPKDAVRSTKLQFKKIFEESSATLATQLGAPSRGGEL